MTTLSAGLALSGAHMVLGQKPNARAEQRQRLLDEADAGPKGDVQPQLDTSAPQLRPQEIRQAPVKAQYDLLLHSTQGTFTPYVGDIFQAPDSRGQLISMTLVSVTQYKMKAVTRLSTKKTVQPDTFTLTFRAEAALPPFTSIHRISHPALGEIDLFLTSRRANDGTLTYEAVISHLP